MQTKLRMTIPVLLCFLLTEICGLATNQLKADGFRGDPELLKLIADQNKQNVLAIRCWQGTVDAIEKHQDKNGTKVQWRRDVDFAFDRQADAWLWRSKVLDLSRTQGDKQLPSQPLNVGGGMVKENAYYLLSPHLPSDKKRKTFVIRPIEQYPRGLTDEFTPMEFFAAEVGEPAYKRFGGLYALAMIGGAKTWTVSQVGDIVKVSTRGAILNHYEVDLSKGANVVRYSAKDGRLSEDIVTEYEEKDGLWLPTLRIHKNTRHDGTEFFYHEYRLRTTDVNHSMNESTISLESLGARAGDRIVDRRDGSDRTFGQ